EYGAPVAAPIDRPDLELLVRATHAGDHRSDARARPRAAAGARSACTLARRRHHLGAAPARGARGRVDDPRLEGRRPHRRLVVVEGRSRAARVRRAARPARPPRRDPRRSRSAHGGRVRGRRRGAGGTGANCFQRARRRAREPPGPDHALPNPRPSRASPAGAAARRLPLPDGRAGRPRGARRDPPRRLGAVTPDRKELRDRPSVVAVPRFPRLRRRGARPPFRRVLPHLARRREPRRRARAGRSARGVPPPRSRRGRLHVRAPAAVRGGRPGGDRVLRHRSCVRALRVDRLPRPRDARRLLALALLVECRLERRLDLTLDIGVDAFREARRHLLLARPAVGWRRLERAIGDAAAVDRELVDVFVLDVLEMLLPEVVDGDTVRELVAEQRARGLREQDLAAVPGRGDPLRADHVEAEVTLLADVWLAGVHAHTHEQLPSARPLVVAQRALRVDRGGHGVARTWEGEEERVALSVDLRALAGAERLAHKPPVVARDAPELLVAELLE